MSLEPKCQQMLDKYQKSLSGSSTCRSRVACGLAFFEWLGSRPIDASSLRLWQKKLARRYSIGTIKLDMDIIHRICNINSVEWPLRRGEGPVVSERDVQAYRLDPLDIRSMIQVIKEVKPSLSLRPDARHGAFLCLSTIWGLRREEMAEMRPEFLDEKALLMFVQTVKSGRQRWHIIPKEVWPYLAEWGFTKSLPLSKINDIFIDLRQMIGFTGDTAWGMSWHSVRRSLVKELELSGVVPSDISSFLRWKRSVSNMQSRYATTIMVGTSTTELDLGREDKDTDQRVLAKHPFLPWWK